MRELEDLTSIVENLARAKSFRTAADLLADWARSYSGCSAATLRLLVAGESQDWLSGCSTRGASESWSRDESVVAGSECLCGRVTSGRTDPGLPFFTPGGSFVCGRMGDLMSEFTVAELGELRGRCVSENYRSIAILPIRGEGRIIGSLHLADTRPDLFGVDIKVVESACRLAGDILLRHQESERERVLLDRIQSALLPSLPPGLDGLSIGVSSGSATDMTRLGGDFYDVIDLGDSGVFVLVGDVCGKGVEAVGTAARIRYALEAMTEEMDDPVRFMQAANSTVMRLLPTGRFATLAACFIEPRNRLIRVCLAGHPSPLRVGAAGGAEMAAPNNPPLGLFPELCFVGSEERLSRDEVLIVYTDGVTDSRRGSTEFGVDGIVATARPLWDQDPSEIAGAVCSAATRFHDSTLSTDDRLVMAIRLD